MGPLFCNLVLNGLKAAAFKGIPKSFKRLSPTEGRSVRNNCVVYGDDVVLIFNEGDRDTILKNVSLFLKERSLELSLKKTKIFKFGEQSFNFDYLGFVFTYVPKTKLKLGSLVSRSDSLAIKKANKNSGSILVSISRQAMNNHKAKLKTLIRSSYNLSVPQLITKLNPIILGFSNYFCFGQSYRQLSWLDMFVFKRIFVALKKKFKKSTVENIVKVNFNNNWRLEGFFKQPKHNDKLRKRHLKQLVKHTDNVVLPIQHFLLGNNVKSLDFYSHRETYAHRNANIYSKIGRNRIKDKLVAKQKGCCLYCNKSIDLEDNIDIHHIFELSICTNEKQIKKSNMHSNLVVLHRSCHKVLHSKKANPIKVQKLLKTF